MLLCWIAPYSLPELKRIQEGLDGQVEVLARWLVFWTGLVVLGLMMEYGPEFTKWKPRNLKKPRSFVWVPIWGFMGGMLVVGGVAGELYVESAASRIETKLRDTSGQIETLLTTEAGDAKSSADGAALAASSAKTSADAAGVAAGKAKDRADAVAKQASELSRELLAAETQLKAVEAKRAELEKSLINLAVCNAPRVLPQWNLGGMKDSVDPLKPFAGYQAIIEFVPNDAEARRAAIQIYDSLFRAGWKARLPTPGPVDRIHDGVSVQPFVGPSPQQAKQLGFMFPAVLRSNQAADAILDFLHSYNWQATHGWLDDDKGSLISDLNIFPADALRIRVGLYPPVSFVAPPGAKDFADVLAQHAQEREQTRKQIEEENAKRDEAYLNTLTPEQALEFKNRRAKRIKEFADIEKTFTDRDTGPCQPLSSIVPSF
jgi:hypothetical protein